MAFSVVLPSFATDLAAYRDSLCEMAVLNKLVKVKAKKISLPIPAKKVLAAPCESQIQNQAAAAERLARLARPLERESWGSGQRIGARQWGTGFIPESRPLQQAVVLPRATFGMLEVPGGNWANGTGCNCGPGTGGWGCDEHCSEVAPMPSAIPRGLRHLRLQRHRQQAPLLPQIQRH